MKFLLSFCFLIALNKVSALSSHWGTRIAGDRLLYRENVIRFPKRGESVSVYVGYPKLTYGWAKTKNVSATYVYDRFTNSSGASANYFIFPQTFVKPKWNQTVVYLRSQIAKGINSTVEFYGK